MVAACAAAPTVVRVALPDEGREVCERLRESQHLVWNETTNRMEPDAYRASALDQLRQHLGVDVAVASLSADEVARFGGATPVVTSGYGTRTRLVGATLSVERTGARVELGLPTAPHGWRPTSSIERASYALFGVPTHDFGPPIGKALVMSWPTSPLGALYQAPTSLSSALLSLTGLFGHLATVGIFWWVPKVGSLTSGSPSPPATPAHQLIRELEASDRWHLEPKNRAGLRWLTEASQSCTAAPNQPCRTFSILEGAEPSPEVFQVFVTYTFESDRQRPCTLTDTLLLAPSHPTKRTTNAVVVSEGPEIEVLPSHAVDELLGLPSFGEEGLVAKCRVEGHGCTVRIETVDGVWEEAPVDAVARALLNPGLRNESLFDVRLEQLAEQRLAAIIDDGPWLTLRRVPDTALITSDLVHVSWANGERRVGLSLPLLPGSSLHARLAATFPNVKGSSHSNEPAVACRWGQPSSCAQLAQRTEGAERIDWLMQACTRGDGASCGDLALHDHGLLNFDHQHRRATALSLACQSGQLWACNDLAVLVGRLADDGEGKLNRKNSLEFVRSLLRSTCEQHQALACDNLAKLPLESTGRFNELLPQRLVFGP